MSTPVFEDDIYEQGEENKDDKKLLVIFYERPVLNEPKSKEAGRKIFDPIEYIKIIVPGQRDTVETEVTDSYRQRFAARYENWKAKITAPESGQPLTEVPWLSVTQVAEFHSMNIKTLEQLADLSDVLAQKYIGFSEIRARAQRFLKAAADAAPDLVLEGKLQERDEKIKEQGELIAAMKSQLDKLSAAQAPKAATKA